MEFIQVSKISARIRDLFNRDRYFAAWLGFMIVYVFAATSYITLTLTGRLSPFQETSLYVVLYITYVATILTGVAWITTNHKRMRKSILWVNIVISSVNSIVAVFILLALFEIWNVFAIIF
jgi:hypothetical protein